MYFEQLSPEEAALSDAKYALRQEFLLRRRTQALPSEANDAIAQRFMQALNPQPGMVVSAYWPLKYEVDTRPLLDALATRGCVTALSAVEKKDAPLVFRRWNPGDALEEWAFGVKQPKVEAPYVIPAIIMVPLVAFDATGARLGFGGGFYDRTLEKFRRGLPLLAVGLAYSTQQAERIPFGPLDQSLDLVITEKETFDWR